MVCADVIGEFPSPLTARTLQPTIGPVMSLLKRITSPDVAEPPPKSFSQCLVAGDTIYVSGQLARLEDGSIGGDGSMLSQATIALGRIKALLEAAGATMDDVAKLTIYVTDISKRLEINEARQKFFTGDF